MDTFYNRIAADRVNAVGLCPAGYRHWIRDWMLSMADVIRLEALKDQERKIKAEIEVELKRLLDDGKVFAGRVNKVSSPHEASSHALKDGQPTPKNASGTTTESGGSPALICPHRGGATSTADYEASLVASLIDNPELTPHQNGTNTMKTLIACFVLLSFTLWLGGYHIVWKPTDAQLFGCSHNYINAKGEDTGECP